jgi:hypothetical protein
MLSSGPFYLNAPREIRTPVLGLKGLRPSPLDDGGIRREFYHSALMWSRKQLTTNNEQPTANALTRPDYSLLKGDNQDGTETQTDNKEV